MVFGAIVFGLQTIKLFDSKELPKLKEGFKKSKKCALQVLKRRRAVGRKTLTNLVSEDTLKLLI